MTTREQKERATETMYKRKEKREKMGRFKEVAKNHCYKCANSSHVFKIGKQSHIHCLIEPMENQGWGSCRFIFDTCEKFKIKQANERGEK